MATRNWGIYPNTRTNVRMLRNIVEPSFGDRLLMGVYNPNFLASVGVFTVGALVGATIGLLFAPRSGQDLRHQLQNRVQSMRPRIGSRGSEVGSMSSDYSSTSPTIR